MVVAEAGQETDKEQGAHVALTLSSAKGDARLVLTVVHPDALLDTQAKSPDRKMAGQHHHLTFHAKNLTT
jgi:hypothetical protein